MIYYVPSGYIPSFVSTSSSHLVGAQIVLPFILRPFVSAHRVRRSCLQPSIPQLREVGLCVNSHYVQTSLRKDAEILWPSREVPQRCPDMGSYHASISTLRLQ